MGSMLCMNVNILPEKEREKLSFVTNTCYRYSRDQEITEGQGRYFLFLIQWFLSLNVLIEID